MEPDLQSRSFLSVMVESIMRTPSSLTSQSLLSRSSGSFSSMISSMRCIRPLATSVRPLRAFAASCVTLPAFSSSSVRTSAAS